MKNFIFSLVLMVLVAGTLISQSGWVWQNPLPQGNSILDIRFINQSTGFCAADAGIVLKTTNSGANWSVIKMELPSELTAISIVNQNVLYAAGNEDVYKTTNSGLTWVRHRIADPGFISSVFFINENIGFLGASEKIFRTRDGGENWTAIDAYSYGSVNAVYFFDENTGYITGAGFYIRKTTNGGIDWFTVYPGGDYGAFLSMVFVNNNNTGFVVGSGGRIRKSTDAGSSWFTVSSGTNNDLYSISGLDSLNLAASGLGGKIIITSNCGTNWTLSNAGSASLNGISYISKGTLFTAGTMGLIFKSTNTGNNWLSLNSGYYSNMHSSHFLNSHTGFVAGSGAILKTTDAGDSWYEVCSGGFRSICFTDNFTGYAAGTGGVIYKSANSGENWTAQISGIYTDLFTICFVNQMTGFAGGYDGGAVLRTSSGGENWDIIQTAPSGQINDISFVNENTGFFVTGNGKIMKTTNSGYNWASVFVSSFGFISEIDFANESTGYAVGGNSLIITANGGDNWAVSIPATGAFLFSSIASVDFVNENTGYIGGLFMLSGGSEVAVSKTTDGGLNWEMQFPGVKLNIYSLFAAGPDTCFITGSNGAILRCAGGFISVAPISTNIPLQSSLFQNYPNPFNPTTKVRFDIPPSRGARGVTARLIICDILGKEVAVLVNEQLNPGTYEVNWDGSNYPSGVYFYQLSINNEQLTTKKMVLLK